MIVIPSEEFTGGLAAPMLKVGPQAEEVSNMARAATDTLTITRIAPFDYAPSFAA